MNYFNASLCCVLLLCSTSWSLDPAFYRPAPHLQIPLKEEFKRLISGKSRKDPAIAVLLAAVPPFIALQGLGQAYNGEIGKALLIFGLGQLSFSTRYSAIDETTADLALAVYLGTWIYSTIDAYRSAKRINRHRGHPNLHSTYPVLTPRPHPPRAYTGHRPP